MPILMDASKPAVGGEEIAFDMVWEHKESAGGRRTWYVQKWGVHLPRFLTAGNSGNIKITLCFFKSKSLRATFGRVS